VDGQRLAPSPAGSVGGPRWTTRATLPVAGSAPFRVSINGDHVDVIAARRYPGLMSEPAGLSDGRLVTV
jgi:hypothetical protein